MMKIGYLTDCTKLHWFRDLACLMHRRRWICIPAVGGDVCISVVEGYAGKESVIQPSA